MDGTWTQVTTESQVHEALGAGRAVIYKHSPVCGASDAALRQIEKLRAELPDLPLYQVDVLAARPLSRRIEEITGIRHESPQALVVCDGRVVWHASHFRVKADAIVETLRGACA